MKGDSTSISRMTDFQEFKATVLPRLISHFLPFADAATTELPMGRLLRLSLFQVSVGMAAALLTGTLNRVMIVELNVPAWLVALMVSLPLVFAPLRALIGFRSDIHRSALGWRRVPYLWFATLLQFGGLAIMPFALLVLSGRGAGPVWAGQLGAALAFLLIGAGMHTVQTAGLALAGDLAPASARPRVIALLYVMLLVGMLFGGLILGALLTEAGPLRLIQVIQGSALVTLVLNGIALWKQEPRGKRRPADEPDPSFSDAWRTFADTPGARRFLVAVALGTAGFSMQDVLLEPYGGEVLKMQLGATSALTALLALGTLFAFGMAARQLGHGSNPHRLAAMGAALGVFAFGIILISAPVNSMALFLLGTLTVGIGGGLFSIGTLTAAMAFELPDRRGLALGAWGAAQATAAGVGIAVGGVMRDVVGTLAAQGEFGQRLAGPATGYSCVYAVELGLLVCAVFAMRKLIKTRGQPSGLTQNVDAEAGRAKGGRFGLASFPG